MAAGPTRWGLAGLGKITHDFCVSIKMLPASEHQIAAVAARQLDRAKEFAEKFDVKTVYGSYKELAQATDIDIVYIGTVHTTHYEVCKLMLENGQNVLVEKPMSLTGWQNKELLELAKQKNVFLVEGIWSRFFPIYRELKKEIDKEKCIGEPRFINVNFGFNFSHIERISSRELGGGCLMDIGLYGIQFVVNIYGGKPVKVVATGTLTSGGVDDFASVTMYYSGNRVAVVNTFMHANLNNSAVICGSKGIIEVPSFWNPSEMKTPNKNYDIPLWKIPDGMFCYHDRQQGFVYQLQGVRKCLLRGDKEASVMSHEDSQIIIDILDEVRRQIGVKYEADTQ